MCNQQPQGGGGGRENAIEPLCAQNIHSIEVPALLPDRNLTQLSAIAKFSRSKMFRLRCSLSTRKIVSLRGPQRNVSSPRPNNHAVRVPSGAQGRARPVLIPVIHPTSRITSRSQPPPQRQPFSYVPDGTFSTPPIVPNQGEYGVRKATASLKRPVTAERAFPKWVNPYPDKMPLPTAVGPDRLFDYFISFPRGDLGAQMFPRDQPKRDGNAWLASAGKQAVVSDLSCCRIPCATRLCCVLELTRAVSPSSSSQREIGSVPKSIGVRAFIAPANPGIIMYQMVPPPPNKLQGRIG